MCLPGQPCVLPLESIMYIHPLWSQTGSALQDITNVQHDNPRNAMPPRSSQNDPIPQENSELRLFSEEILQNFKAETKSLELPMTTVARTCENKVVESWKSFFNSKVIGLCNSLCFIFLCGCWYSSVQPPNQLKVCYVDGPQKQSGSVRMEDSYLQFIMCLILQAISWTGEILPGPHYKTQLMA